MNLRVAVTGEAKGHEAPSRSESEPEQGEVVSQETNALCAFESLVADAKPSDLHMSRVKSG